MSESENIPVAPGIKLENLIDFKGDCIDPLTLVIITESLDYALESAARRLKAAGKIYPKLQEDVLLPVVKAIRNELQRAPQCQVEGPPKVIKPPPEPPKTTKAPKTVAEPVTKATVAELKKVEQVVKTGTGLTPEILELIKSKPELMTVMKTAAPKAAEAIEEIKVKERSLPATWGEVVKFEGKDEEAKIAGEYTSPQELANRLGIKTRGASTMVKAFERAGFKVTTNGDARPVKGKTTGFVVKRISPTPEKYQKPKTAIPEDLSAAPPSPLKERWFTRRGEGGVILGWDWIDPESDKIVPEKFRKVGSAPAPAAETIRGQTSRVEKKEIEDVEPGEEELAEIEEE